MAKVERVTFTVTVSEKNVTRLIHHLFENVQKELAETHDALRGNAASEGKPKYQEAMNHGMSAWEALKEALGALQGYIDHPEIKEKEKN
jgi:hypothetical protein